MTVKTLLVATIIGLGANPEYDVSIIRYNYASMITPNSTFEYDLTTRKSTLIKQMEIPSGYDQIPPTPFPSCAPL